MHRRDGDWPFLVRSWEWLQAPSCLVFLVAFRIAEHAQLIAIPQWLRYAIIIPPAALLYFLVSIWIWAINLSGQSLPEGALATHLTWSAAHAVLVSIIVAIVYSSVMRSRRAQTAFDAAALQRAATARRVAAARLATLQAQVDPALLFSTLEFVEALYERDPDAAESTLADLIDFLRTALPKVGEEGSTLGREMHLARAYLAIVARAHGQPPRCSVLQYRRRWRGRHFRRWSSFRWSNTPCATAWSRSRTVAGSRFVRRERPFASR